MPESLRSVEAPSSAAPRGRRPAERFAGLMPQSRRWSRRLRVTSDIVAQSKLVGLQLRDQPWNTFTARQPFATRNNGKACRSESAFKLKEIWAIRVARSRPPRRSAR